jgi:hypothetical protein
MITTVASCPAPNRSSVRYLQSPPLISSSGETPIPAIDQWGQAVAITSGATATLASIPSSATGYQIKGFVAIGTGDGYFFVQIASVTVLSGRIRAAMPMCVITLPNGILVTTGEAVALKVTNESGSTADFEATLLGA